MDITAWRQAIGEMVRAHMSTSECNRYFSLKATQPRAQLLLKELSLFTRHRRDCWSYVSGNCPIFPIKQKILEHEYGEVIRDKHSEHGHLRLIIRQGVAIGLTTEDILNAQPIPSTRATLYAWGWMCKQKNWIEALPALTVTEWTNDDRLLADLGGGQSTRLAKRWMEDLGLQWKDLPNFRAHQEADEEHSDMFLPFLAELATGDKEKSALKGVQESLNLMTIYRGGVADAMEKLS
jgi:pyrroloquinoline quinone (PQQ) biosynthesis protein C